MPQNEGSYGVKIGDFHREYGAWTDFYGIRTPTFMAYKPRLSYHMSRFYWVGGGLQYIDHLHIPARCYCSPCQLSIPKVGNGKRGHYERGLFTRGISRISRISKFLRISRKWSESPLFSTVWGFSRMSRISKFSRISREWSFLKRPLFQKTPFSEPEKHRNPRIMIRSRRFQIAKCKIASFAASFAAKATEDRRMFLLNNLLAWFNNNRGVSAFSTSQRFRDAKAPDTLQNYNGEHPCDPNHHNKWEANWDWEPADLVKYRFRASGPK